MGHRNYIISADQDLSDLHIGTYALAKKLISAGWEVTKYDNPAQFMDIPAFRAERDGKQVNVWVSSYIRGQEPEIELPEDQIRLYNKNDVEQSLFGSCVVVICTDIGSGYTFEYKGLEFLEGITGELIMPPHVCKPEESDEVHHEKARIIETEAGNLELSLVRIDDLRGFEQYWPSKLIEYPGKQGAFMLSFQQGDQEILGLKLKPLLLPERGSVARHHMNRALIALALPEYLSKNHKGVMLPCAYHKKKDWLIDSGIAFFVVPDPASRSESVDDATRALDPILGDGATVMITDMIEAIKKASHEHGIRMMSVTGTELRRSVDLGNLYVHFVIAGPRLFVVRDQLYQGDATWQYVVKAGFSKLPYAPMTLMRPASSALDQENEADKEKPTDSENPAQKNESWIKGITVEQAIFERDRAVADTEPCSLSLYREIVRKLPRPTPEQVKEYVHFVSNAHSWYKHLPLLPPGPIFQFFIDPRSAHDRVYLPGGQLVYRERTRDSQRFHYTWMTTEEYRARFGCLSYASGGAGTALSLVSSNTITDYEDLPVFGYNDDACPVPREIALAGSVEVTAIIHDRTPMTWTWRDLSNDFKLAEETGDMSIVEGYRWPEETGGEETLKKILALFRGETRVWRKNEDGEDVDADFEEALRPEKERLQKNMADAINRMLALVYDEK